MPDAVGSDDHVAALDEGPIVRTALRGLDPRQRRLLLQWECRRSTESLATTEQVSAAVLKQVVVRARRNFRERYRAACGQADGLRSAVAPPFIGLALRLRSRLRFGPTRYDAVAASLGLAACSVALVAANVTQDPAHSRAVELVSSHAVAVPDPTSVDTAPVATDGEADTRPAEQPSVPITVAPNSASSTTVDIDSDRAEIGVTSNNPVGETWSIRELTVRCDAGTTTRAICAVGALAPSPASGGGDP